MPSDSFRQRASNCALLTITVVCICILVLSGVMIVQEYSLAKFYAPAQCKINNITYSKPDIYCKFCEAKDKTKEKGASACVQSRLPCIHIDVAYEAHGRSQEALLHPDSLQAASPLSAGCSFTVCLKTYELNKDEVDRYAATWRKLQANSHSFPCYYNTVEIKTAIVKKMHSKEDVIHSMLWPSLLIVVCGVIFLRLEMKRRGLSFCGEADFQPNGPRNAGPPAHDMRNGSNGTELKQTLLLLPNDDISHNNKVQCSLLKNHGVISSSMPALDRLKPTAGDHSSKLNVPALGASYNSIGRDQQNHHHHQKSQQQIGSSLSVDGLKLHQVRSLDEKSDRNGSGTHLLSAIPKEKFRQDSTKTEGGSSTGSQGSKIMGLETPV